MIDEKMSRKEHISELCNTLIQYTGIFYRVQNHLPYNIAIQMYYIFIYSRITYGIKVYGMCKDSVLKPLQTMQNRILKMLTYKPRTYSTNLLHESLFLLNMLKVKDIHTAKMNTCTLIYKYTKNMIPAIYGSLEPPILLLLSSC